MSFAITGMRKKLLALCATLPLACGNAGACTLFGVAGREASGRGPIVMKNRDREDTGRQEAALSTGTGYAYFALAVRGGKSPGVKAGVNEKGLTVLTASVSSLPARYLRAVPRTHALAAKLLRACATVDEAAASPLLRGPAFLVLADTSSIAYVEVPPEGAPVVRKVTSGHVAHTNHYLDLPAFNRKGAPDDGSHVRLARVSELLGAPGRPLAYADLKRISLDRNAGPDKSLFRTGSAPDKPRTLAVWCTDYSDPASPRVELWLKDGAPVSVPLSTLFSRQAPAAPKKD